MSKNKSFTLNDNTFATNPGNIRLNVLVWTKYHFSTVAILSLGVLFPLLLSVVLSKWFLVFLMIGLLANGWYWFRRKEHFAMGAANPGRVISVQPPLVAVITELANQPGYELPAIKIISYPIGRPVKLGQEVGTVALYSYNEDPELPFWIDFNPIPIDLATNNAAEIKRAFESYPAEDWALLDRGIPQLPQPYQKGIYKIDVEDSDWKDFVDAEIGCD